MGRHTLRHVVIVSLTLHLILFPISIVTLVSSLIELRENGVVSENILPMLFLSYIVIFSLVLVGYGNTKETYHRSLDRILQVSRSDV